MISTGSTLAMASERAVFPDAVGPTMARKSDAASSTAILPDPLESGPIRLVPSKFPLQLLGAQTNDRGAAVDIVEG